MKSEQDIVTVHKNTVASMTNTLQTSQIQERKAPHFDECTKLRTIPNIPSAQEKGMFTDVVVPIRIPPQSQHQSPMAAQKKKLHKNVEPTLPPFGGALDCGRPHEEHIFFRNPNLKITCTSYDMLICACHPTTAFC